MAFDRSRLFSPSLRQRNDAYPTVWSFDLSNSILNIACPSTKRRMSRRKNNQRLHNVLGYVQKWYHSYDQRRCPLVLDGLHLRLVDPTPRRDRHPNHWQAKHSNYPQKRTALTSFRCASTCENETEWEIGTWWRFLSFLWVTRNVRRCCWRS